MLAALLATGCSSSNMPSATSDTRTDGNDQIVAWLDGEPITLDAFQDNFDRNGRVSADLSPMLSDYEDFLDRFVDFRLKVMEARRLGMDKEAGLQEEIQQYRMQLARPYLFEHQIYEPLVREMYDRRKEAVEAAHILIRLEPSASPTDTLAAFERLSAIRDSVVAGSSFGRLAAQFSEDPSAKGAPGTAGYQGALGYFGGGRMVEAFEDMAFNTPVGGVSPIFRTQFGYHILQVSDRIPMPAERTLAHIMVRVQGNTPADQAATESKLDSIRTRLESGLAFSEAAARFSEDQNSANQGGEIGRLSLDAGLPFSFRDAAYSLESKGDWTGPIRTIYGYHFIQFVEEFPLGTFEEEYETLKNRVSQMPRLQAAQDAFAASIRASVDTWVDTARVDEWATTMRVDSLVRWMAAPDFQSPYSDEPFVRFADSTLTVAQFSAFFRSTVMQANADTRGRVMDYVDRWLDDRAIDYEIDRLERRDDEFAITMQDFRDGLLLFRFMEQEVWNGASSDTTALLAHWEANRASYQFPDRVRVVSYSSPNESALKQFVQRVRSVGIDEALIASDADSTLMLRADTTFVTEPTGSMFDEVLTLEEGQVSDARSFNRGWIALYHSGTDAAREMTFDEARPEVINEVQGVFEQRILTDLRQRYGVRTYPERLQQLVVDP
ncbi:MAG: peptidylprolyl isomerase [Bacteroidetes bacterium]|nr:peptidylprolyl isomerase [Bacteroidota bacterium]